MRNSARALLVAVTVLGSTYGLAACGGDDSSGGSSSGSSGTPVPTGTSTATTPVPTTPPPPVDAGPPPPVDAGPPLATLAAPTFAPAPGTFTSSVPGGVTITATPADATIFFTTDGTNPTPASVVYSGAISVATTTTIRAIAAKAGFNNSPVSGGTYTITPPAPGQLSDVAINPATGTYPNPQSVGLSVPVAEQPATICYTLDGSSPTCNAATAMCTGTAATYSAGAPLQIDSPVGGAPTKVRAIACKVGQKTSVNVSESSFSFKAADPTATLPVPSEVAPGTQITLQTVTAGAGTDVHYRIDGAAPNCLAAVAGGEQACGGSACLVPINENTTIRAIACKPNYANSAIVPFAYTVRVAPSTLAPAAIYYNDVTSGAVAATRTSGGPVVPTTNCWSTGATTPVCNAAGNGCVAPATSSAPVVTADNTQVNVVGCKSGTAGVVPGGFTPSALAFGTFRLQVAAISVTPTPAGGIFSPAGTDATTATNYWNAGTATSFTLDTATSDTAANDVKIRYSTTAAVPSCVGAVGAGITEVTKGTNIGSPAAFTTIRAIGCKPNYQPSAQRALTYQDPANTVILDPVPAPTTSDNNIAVLLTSTPAAGIATTDTHICFNVGQGPVGAPDCDPLGNPALAQGLCTGGSTRYDPAVPFTVKVTGFEVKAIACKTGVPNKSAPISAVFTFKMGAPIFTDGAGILPASNGNVLGASIPYNSAINFHSSSEPSKSATTEYRWTTNGTDPSCTVGQGPAAFDTFLPPNNNPLTYKVLACDSSGAFLPSSISTVAFSGFLSPPTFGAPGTNGGSSFNLQVPSTTISSTNAADGYLCYTTDGSPPACIGGGTCTGTKIATNAGPVNVSINPTTIKAVSCRNTGFFASTVATSGVFNLAVEGPTVGPADGPQVVPVTIAISNGQTTPANVCWTQDGSDVSTACGAAVGTETCESRTAGQALTIPGSLVNKATNFTLKVRACRAGFASSAQVVRTYTFSPYTRTIVIDGLDDWAPAENSLPSESGDNGYLSWDATNVYFGWRGANLINSANEYFGVYLRSPAGPYTQTRDDRLGADKFGLYTPGVNWGMMPQPTGGVDFHFFVRTDRNEAAGASQWNGATWATTAATVTCVHGGQLGTASALVECSVARASIGLGGANAQLTLNGVISTTASGSHNEWPYLPLHGFFSGNMSTNIPSDPALRSLGVLP